jgi:hypothetical protein
MNQDAFDNAVVEISQATEKLLAKLQSK